MADDNLSNPNNKDFEKMIDDTNKHVETDDDVVDFDGPDDPLNPLNWSTAKKTTAITVVTIMTLLSPIASTISSTAEGEILSYFQSDNATLGSFATSIFLLGYAFGPIVIAPLSELYGRSPLYLICQTLFIVFNVACAVSPSLGALIVFRFFVGIMGSCPVTLGTGSIADMVPREKRAGAMSAYIIGAVFGPSIGPLCGGYLAAAAGWQWNFWLVSIAGGAVLVLTVFLLPETYPYVLLERKTRRLRKSTGNVKLHSALAMGKTPAELFAFSIFRPLKMFLSPIVLLLSLYAAVVYSYLYLCFTTYGRVFGTIYGFNSGEAGLVSLGVGIGAVLGVLFVGPSTEKLSRYLTAKNGGDPRPEYRLPLMVASGITVPIGLFWYGWSAEARTHWIVPIIGTGFIGFGLTGTYMPSTMYLVDAFHTYAASVTASSTILRSLLGALLPLAGPSMYDALGVGWGNSLLGFISVAFLPVPIIFYVYGERLRNIRLFGVQF